MFWSTDKVFSGRQTVTGFIIALVGLTACESGRQPTVFYAMDSLVSAQVHHLTRIGAGLRKEAFLRDSADTVVYVPGDTAMWNKELDIFRQLDVINKPVNRHSYLVEDGLADSGSNLTIREFRRREVSEGESMPPVVYLKVYYQGSVDKPRRIDALYEDVNPMFRSRRHLTMRFEQINGQILLAAYKIEGGQKMMLSDSIAYYVNGKILAD